VSGGRFTIGGDLVVDRLGFGAMRVTGEGIWGEPDDPDECRKVLRRAVELGVTLIDTADSYGPEVSERLIGETLAPYPDDLVLATKAGFLRPGPNRWETDGRPEHLREALEGSLRRLGLERVDLFQLHRIDRNVPAEDQLGTLADLQREGKIRHVGLSQVGVDELRSAREIVAIASVQNRYGLTDRSSDDVLAYCEDEGIGFLPWAPLDAGRLTRSGGPLDRAAGRLDATPGQVALAWLLRRSPVMLPIPGTSKVGHLEENMAAGELEVPDDLYEELTAAA
jgi:aryl-alcohol dehydrogenase-like predicted oxidoreductase